MSRKNTGVLTRNHKKQAIEMIQAGKLDAAEQLLVKVCERCPADIEGWLLRSAIHGQRREHDAVMACSRRIIAVNPRHPRAYSNLGAALAGLGRNDEAIEALRTALELNPEDPATLNNLGNTLYLSERVEEAETYFRRALEIDPSHARSLYGLGHVLADMGYPEEAVRCYQKAVQIMPEIYEAWLGLGKACMNMGRHEMATDCFRRAMALTDNPVEPLCCMARVDQFMGRYDEGLGHLAKALQVSPGNLMVEADRLMMLYRKGDTEAAYDLLQELLQKGLASIPLLGVYSEICRKLGSCGDVIRVGRALLEEKQIGRVDRGYIYFAMAEAYKSMQEYDEAFLHFKQGNDSMPHRFDHQAFTGEIDRLISAYSADAIAMLPCAANNSERPVFIVGMPRSGTSLTEQILSMHPRVFGGGERNDINDIAGKLSARLGREYTDCIQLIPQPLLNEMANGYLRKLDELSATADRVIDKMPHNFLRLGLIAQLFPGARIIHCTRDPRDTCLSIYFQRFNRTHSYACELGDLAYYYLEYQRLMKHWERVLDIGILEVNYETLVGDLEGGVRRMLDFLGLEWDERCLRFHESDRAVATASYDQVRQPLYTKSIARWKRYERHLGPLLEGLGLKKGGAASAEFV